MKSSKKALAKRNNRRKVLGGIYPPKDNRCQECGELAMFPGIHLHHKVFRSHGGMDDLDNLIWLCYKCHAAKHGEKIVDSEVKWSLREK